MLFSFISFVVSFLLCYCLSIKQSNKLKYQFKLCSECYGLGQVALDFTSFDLITFKYKISRNYYQCPECGGKGMKRISISSKCSPKQPISKKPRKSFRVFRILNCD